jgi:hypothetical protein
MIATRSQTRSTSEKDVRREENRPAFALERVEDSVKRPLHQRVESFGRFVEDR